MTRLIRALDAISETTGRAVAWCALVMVLAQALVVVLRYVFAIGSIPLQESIWYLHGLIFMLGAAYTLRQDAHVRIDIFYRRLGAKGQALVDAAGVLLFLLPLSVLGVTLAWPYVEAAWRVREGSAEASGLPFLFLLKSVIPLTFGLLALQGVSLLLRALTTLAGAPPRGADETETAMETGDGPL